MKVGGRYYIDLDDLNRWISNQSVVPQPATATRAAPRAMQPGAADAVLAARRKGSRQHSEGGCA